MKQLLSYKKSLIAGFTAVALSCTALSPAFGLDKETFSKRLNTATESMFIELSSDNIEVNNNNVVMHDTVVKYVLNNSIDKEKDVKSQLNLGDAYFDNITEQDGYYTVGLVRVPDLSETSLDATFNIKGLTFDNLILSDKDNENFISNGLLYETMLLKQMTYSWKGKKVFELNGLESHYSPFNKKTPIEISSKIDNFTFDANATGDPQVITTMTALGLQSLTGSGYTSGTWDAFGDGRFNINESVLKIDNAGTLKSSMSFSGLTKSVLNAINSIQQQSLEKNVSSEELGLKSMAIMQQIKIKDMNIRYEDAGFVNKLIEYQAKQQGTSSGELKNSIKQIVPFFASQLKSPNFTKEIQDATTAFIDDPKSLTFTVAPENEVSIAALALVGAMGSEGTAKIIEMLNFHVVANK